VGQVTLSDETLLVGFYGAASNGPGEIGSFQASSSED
jgi:hypothetical protein